MGPHNSTYSTFPLKERHFSQNVLLSAEMLNMLNSLAQGSPSNFPQNIQQIQHIQHFCRKKHSRVQHIQHFPWKNDIFLKKCFSLLKCWICWIPLTMCACACACVRVCVCVCVCACVCVCVCEWVVSRIRIWLYNIHTEPNFGHTKKTRFYYKPPEKCHFAIFEGNRRGRDHIYIYIYICMLWSYYLGHVWGFLIVTNWATFVFWKGCLSKTL